MATEATTVPLNDLMVVEAWEAYLESSASLRGFRAWVSANQPELFQLVKEPQVVAIAQRLEMKHAFEAFLNDGDITCTPEAFWSWLGQHRSELAARTTLAQTQEFASSSLARILRPASLFNR